MENEKIRADRLLALRGLFSSREKAAGAIEAGRVSVGGRLITKASAYIERDAEILVIPALEYVGRGALKLEYALDEFKIDLNGRVCLDVGASTGGFTEIMLRRGASRVYAVDVGSAQLSKELIGDARVVSMEKTDIRGVTRESLNPAPDFCAVDVSFISLTKILSNSLALVDGRECVALVKPQFEAGRRAVGKKGVVRDINIHIGVLSDIFAYVRESGSHVRGAVPSPITGGSGNREYLLWLGKTQGENPFKPDIVSLVRAAFARNY